MTLREVGITEADNEVLSGETWDQEIVEIAYVMEGGVKVAELYLLENGEVVLSGEEERHWFETMEEYEWWAAEFQ